MQTTVLPFQLCNRVSPCALSSNGFRFLRQLGLALLFAAVLSPVLARAQDLAGLEQGTKPYGAYHGGDIDSVSMANGNLTLHIPIDSYPQRGGKLHLGFSLVYTNPVYTLTFTPDTNPGHRCSVAGCFVWSWNNASGSVGGGSALSIKLDFPTVGITWNCNISPCIVWDYKVLEPDGAAHQMWSTSSGNDISLDTTGYTFVPAQPVMLDRHGTRYWYNTANGYPAAMTEIEDVNGNLITGNLDPNNSASVLSYTDTMGRVIPNYSQAGPYQSVSTSACPSGNGLLAATSAWAMNFPGPNGSTTTYTVCYAAFSLNYTSICNGYSSCAGLTGSTRQIQSIVLPNGTAWNFAFDTTGALSKITLPTGGTISYSWGQNYYCTPTAFGATVTQFTANALSRTVNANDGTGSHTWNYALSPTSGAIGQTAQTIVTDPFGNDAVHTLTPMKPTGQATCSLYETELDEYSGSHSSGTLLRKTSTSYSSSGILSPPPNGPSIALNVVPLSITVTDVTSGKSSKTTKSWDSGVALTGNLAGVNALYGDIITQNDYDFTGSLLRTTNNAYMALSGPNASSYLANNLLSLPYTAQVKDGSGNQMSLTQYNYDETARTSSGLTSSYQFNSSAFGNYRGNNTAVLQWLNTGAFTCPNGNSGGSNGYLISKKTYFDDGMLDTSADPCSNTTDYDYSLTYWGALATTVTNALNQAMTNTYDFNTSLLASTTDPNTLTTSYSYDSMWRILQVNHPDGGQDIITHQESTFPFSSALTTTINSSQNKVETNNFDGFGRVSETQLTSDPQGIVYTDTTYDALGRVATVSNPYRRGTDATTSTGTTTYGYDALSRKLSVTYPDNSVLKTAYCGPSTLVTDPTGRWRRSRVDGLGRLVEVDEPNAVGASVNSNGCPGTGEPIWVTSYNLDGLGNLTQVVQNSSHTRTFTYDSLSRLLTAYNPENSEVINNITQQVIYTYNPDSTLATKTDARNITASYSWDALHRQTGVSYTNDPNNTPPVAFAYDQSNCLGLTTCQNIGHRTSMTDGAGSESWAYQVDKTNLRSIHKEQRTNNSSPNNVTKTTTYYLDLAGNVTQLVYPTGRTVNYTYDSADRPSSAADSSNGITYVADWKTPPASTNCTSGAVCYTPHGSVYAMSVDQTSSFTGLNLLESFNSRLQPNEIKASSTAGTVIDITYSFVDPATNANAGHVYKITNNLNSSRTQSFTYDQLNRVLTAGTSATTGTYCWGYQYTYDAYANLNSQAGQSGYGSCTEGISSATADGNNHLSGFSYDYAGNTLSDGNYSYTWDAESQLKTAGGVTYSYDGDGRRAAKVGSKLYWYGSGGEVLAETDASGNTQNEYVFFGKERIAVLPAGSNPMYYSEDFLGSSRVLVQSNGALCYDADFTPYGGERAYTATCSQNYKFQGKERDTETQNDDFGAREYTWRFGRWLSSDWSATPVPVAYANLSNPQTLNLYAMVTDDPESFADLDGHTEEPLGILNLINNVEETAQQTIDAIVQPLIDSATATAGAAQTVEEQVSSQAPSDASAVEGGLLGSGLRIVGGAAGIYLGEMISPHTTVGQSDTAERAAMQQAEKEREQQHQDAEPASASGGARKGGGNIRDNKAKGDAYRDRVADSLKASGRDVSKEVYKKTPFGPRVIDIEVTHNGKTLGGVETKTGNSPYTSKQRAKDNYLKQQGYPVNVSRQPNSQ